MATGVSYAFAQCIGRGGFGEVYLATQQRGALRQRVAIKVLKPGMRDEGQALYRLRDEARMLAALDHPAILVVHELTRLAGRVALVMEYVDGVDLRALCGPDVSLPRRASLEIVAQVASALDCAWNTVSPDTGAPLNLVHRDIKPDNLRISRHGQVKLLDFGIARTQELGREARTASGDMPFTPGYAPPEAFVSAAPLGAHTDIFALGITWYRIATGQRFFEGKKMVEQVHLSAEPAAYAQFLAERLAKLSPADAAWLSSCLAHDPAARPTAAALAEAVFALAEQASGASLRSWMAEQALPAPEPVADAPLVGQTLQEDPKSTMRIPRPVPPPAPPGLTAIQPQLERPPRAVPQDLAAPRRWPMLGGLLALGIALALGAGAVIGASVLVGWWWWR